MEKFVNVCLWRLQLLLGRPRGRTSWRHTVKTSDVRLLHPQPLNTWNENETEKHRQVKLKLRITLLPSHVIQCHTTSKCNSSRPPHHTTVSCTNDFTLRSGELGASLLVSDAYWLSEPCGIAAPPSKLLSSVPSSASMKTFSASSSTSGKGDKSR